MPTIIPIRDLGKTSQISEMCHQSKEPIYVTKNGYADLVIMSATEFDIMLEKQKMYEKLVEGMADIAAGKVSNGQEVMKALGEKYGLV